MTPTRRHFVQSLVSIGALAALPACVTAPLARAQDRCAAPTGADIEGPFYLAGAPLRRELATAAQSGTPLVLSGRVLAGCAAAPDAVLDVWQADDAGRYDLSGFGLRGRFAVERDGRFEIRTILPGHYLNGPQYRPAHVHVKVRVPGRPELTTQLYFAGDPYNAIDPWFRPERAIHTERHRAGLAGEIDLVVR